MGLQEILAQLGVTAQDNIDYDAAGGPDMSAIIQSPDRGSEDVIADIMRAIAERPEVELSTKERILGGIGGALSNFANMRQTGRQGTNFLDELRQRRQRELGRGQREKLAGLQMELGSTKDKEREATRVEERKEGLALGAKQQVRGERRQDAQVASDREYGEEQAGIEFERNKELIALRQANQKNYGDARADQLDDDMRNAVSAAYAEADAMIYGNEAEGRQALPEGADVVTAIQRYRSSIKKFGLSEKLMEQMVEEFSVALEAAGFRRDRSGTTSGGGGKQLTSITAPIVGGLKVWDLLQSLTKTPNELRQK